MKEIRTQDAVGHILCHDLTRIVPGESKGAAFRKGHVVTEEDIPLLLSMGKEHLYVWELQPGMLHENDAAQILYNICAGPNMRASDVSEGKIEVIAACAGLLEVDDARLRAVNSLGEMMIATRHGGFAVKEGDKLAGTRIIPLLIAEETMRRAKEAAGEGPLLTLTPFRPKKVGVVSTGSEIYSGRIEDKFTPVIVKKVKELGGEMLWHETLPDAPDQITATIREMAAKGAEMVLCTGGMSVDPDDRTPLAIRNTGAEIVSYGAPVLPGAMFLLAYLGGVPVVGLPGCVMYARRTIFDLVLPYLMADRPVTREWLAGLGQGGLCLQCGDCTFPNCSFGK